VVLFPTPDLTGADRQVLDQIDRMRVALRHDVRTPTKRTAGLRTFLTADAVAASNSIEGFKVATVDVEDFSYSTGLLNALHWMLQGHRHSVRRPAGQWRKGPVHVTDPAIRASPPTPPPMPCSSPI
jgi:hypothetical protein